MNHVGEVGSVVAYNAGFEGGVLRRLAENFPLRTDFLLGIESRLWDQLPIIRNHYQHYKFGNSNSIKAVLPVIAPELSYKQLEIGDGGTASSAWEEMVNSTDLEKKQSIKHALLAYCKLDTLAMVKIHEHLVAITSTLK